MYLGLILRFQEIKPNYPQMQKENSALKMFISFQKEDFPDLELFCQAAISSLENTGQRTNIADVSKQSSTLILNSPNILSKLDAELGNMRINM